MLLFDVRLKSSI